MVQQGTGTVPTYCSDLITYYTVPYGTVRYGAVPMFRTVPYRYGAVPYRYCIRIKKVIQNPTVFYLFVLTLDQQIYGNESAVVGGSTRGVPTKKL
jgi:hypothetical protein